MGGSGGSVYDLYDCRLCGEYMLIENSDYFVHLVPFPPGMYDGAVMPNDDGTFSIYIDSNADDEHRRIALEHELNHIRLDHFYSEKPLDVIEAEADLGQEITPETVAKEVKPVPIPAASEWLTSWQRAMEWADLMREKYGAGDDVPLYVV